MSRKTIAFCAIQDRRRLRQLRKIRSEKVESPTGFLGWYVAESRKRKFKAIRMFYILHDRVIKKDASK